MSLPCHPRVPALPSPPLALCPSPHRRPHLDFGLAPIGNIDILKFFPGFETSIKNLLIEMLCEWMEDPDRFQIYNANPPTQTEALDTGTREDGPR